MFALVPMHKQLSGKAVGIEDEFLPWCTPTVGSACANLARPSRLDGWLLNSKQL